ncbi:MAG: hypothetical protein ACLRIO_01720 [Butyricicoccus sp.]
MIAAVVWTTHGLADFADFLNGKCLRTPYSAALDEYQLDIPICRRCLDGRQVSSPS